MRLRFIVSTFFLIFSTLLLAQTAPDFNLTTTDGTQFSLYEGHLNEGRTVMLEIFFVDCPPCRRLAPQMATLHESLVEREIAVDFISISVVSGDDVARIEEFKTEFKHDWDFVTRNEESIAALQPYQDGTFGTYFGTPTTIVIAPDGTVSNIRGNIGIDGDWTGKLEEKILETQADKMEEVPMNPPPATAVVTGGITTVKGNGLAGVTINFSGGKDTAIISNDLGNFQTGSLLADTTYTVTLEKNDDVNNGVTTLDIVLVSKHILGIEPFVEDYQNIAADVNKSGAITTFDLVIMRQVILGILDAFPTNKSWVFQPAEVTISALQELGALEFKATKIGDVNASANPSGLLTATDRQQVGTFNISIVNQQFKAGEPVRVVLHSQNIQDIQGFQFTIDFDPNQLILNDLIKSDLPEFSADNLNLKNKNKGLLTTSWNGTTTNNNANLLELSFTAVSDGKLEEALKINSKKTPAESYNLAGELLGVQLSFEPILEKPVSKISLFPNPNKGNQVFLSWQNTQPQPVQIMLSNSHGQIVQNFNLEVAAGTQFVNLDINNLASGVFTVQIIAGGKLLDTQRFVKQ